MLVPEIFRGEEQLLYFLFAGAVLVAVLTAALLVVGPRVLGRSNLQVLNPGKERLEAEAAIREALLKSLGIFGSIIAATAVAFTYIDKVNSQNEGVAAQAYFEAVKNLQSATSEQAKALSLSSIAAIARSSRNLTPMAMDLFATFIRSSHRVQSGIYELEGISEASIAAECGNVRARFPIADVEVIINAMAARRPDYDRGLRHWNLSGLDLHSVFFTPGFGGPNATVSLIGSKLSGAGFQSTIDLSSAHLEYADLACTVFGPSASLAGAHLHHADLRGAVLATVDLANADLSEADLRMANFKDAKLSGANLRSAKVCRNQVHEDDFAHASNLSLADYLDCPSVRH